MKHTMLKLLNDSAETYGSKSRFTILIIQQINMLKIKSRGFDRGEHCIVWYMVKYINQF